MNAVHLDLRVVGLCTVGCLVLSLASLDVQAAIPDVAFQAGDDLRSRGYIHHETHTTSRCMSHGHSAPQKGMIQGLCRMGPLPKTAHVTSQANRSLQIRSSRDQSFATCSLPSVLRTVHSILSASLTRTLGRLYSPQDCTCEETPSFRQSLS